MTFQIIYWILFLFVIKVMDTYNAEDLDAIILFLYEKQSQNLADCYGYLANDMGKNPFNKDIREIKSSYKCDIRKKYEKLGFHCFNKFERDGIKVAIEKKLQNKAKNAQDIYEKISCILNENEIQQALDILLPLLQSEKEIKIKKSKNVSTSKIVD